MVSSDPVVEVDHVGKGAKSKKRVELLKIPVGSVKEDGSGVNQSAPPPPTYEEYIQDIPIYPRLGEWVPVVKQPTGLSVLHDSNIIPRVGSVLPESSELSKVGRVETLPSESTNSQPEAGDVTLVNICPPDLDLIPPVVLDGASASVTVSGVDILYDDGCEKDGSGPDAVESVKVAAVDTSTSGLIVTERIPNS